MKFNRCLHADVRAGLRELVAAGVQAQMVVTSPPYWGLRAYGNPPVEFGGDPSCAHEWGERITIVKGGPHGADVMLEGGRAVVEAQAAMKHWDAGAFCRRCDAWRGDYGLEPLHDCLGWARGTRCHVCYVCHTLEIFALVREVLADDGTLWLNLGDTWQGAARGGYHKNTERGEAGGSFQTNNRGSLTVGAQPNRMPVPGLKPKDMALIPQRVALALQAAGWWVRSEIIWHKPNPMPESVTDRPTKAHEQIWLLSKSERYYYDADAIKEPSSPDTHARMARAKGAAYHPPGQDGHRGALAARANAKNGTGKKALYKQPSGWNTGVGAHREARGRYPRSRQNASFQSAISPEVLEERNKRDVWTVPTSPYDGAHFATFPPKLIEPCILAGSRPRDLVLDPFIGSGTTGEVCERLGRRWLGIELGEHNLKLVARRAAQQGITFLEGEQDERTAQEPPAAA